MTKNFKMSFKIAGTILLACALVFILYSLSFRPDEVSSQFVRKFNSTNARIENVLEINNITSISGASKSHLFFQTPNPNVLLSTTKTLTGIKTITLGINVNQKFSSRFESYVDSPNVYILAGNARSILTTRMDAAKELKYEFPKSVFTRSVVIDSNLFAFRGISSEQKIRDQILFVGNPVTKNIVRENNISEKNGDLGLSTDGLLHYDSRTQILLYVFFYRNGFLRLDSNLNLIGKTLTIDSTLKRKSLENTEKPPRNKSTFSHSKPIQFINIESCVSKGLLHNNSGIKAKNENIQKFEENSVIDVYSISDGKYISSYYIPKFKKEKLLRFKVFDDLLIVLYPNYLVTYRLDLLDE